MSREQFLEEYVEINMQLVWQTVQRALPPSIDQVSQISSGSPEAPL